jgi:uncharacterized protein (DUF58 family)
MDSTELQQARNEAIQAANRLRLPLRTRSWKGQAGEFAGGGTGSSLDFQDHRAYVPGDDPRHINWQAYARSGTYTMKLFREEVRPIVDVILDASESMFFEPAKARRTAGLLYFLCAACQGAGASVRVTALRGDAALRLAEDEISSHRWFEAMRKLSSPRAADAPNLTKVPLRASSVRVFLSDLLYDADPLPLLRHLGERHGSAILFAPHSVSESAPDWSGNYEFIDTERGSREAHRIEPAVLGRYRASYAAHFALWKSACLRHQAAFVHLPAEDDLASALFREAVPVRALESI